MSVRLQGVDENRRARSEDQDGDEERDTAAQPAEAKARLEDLFPEHGIVADAGPTPGLRPAPDPRRTALRLLQRHRSHSPHCPRAADQADHHTKAAILSQ